MNFAPQNVMPNRDELRALKFAAARSPLFPSAANLENGIKKWKMEEIDTQNLNFKDRSSRKKLRLLTQFGKKDQ